MLWVRLLVRWRVVSCGCVWLAALQEAHALVDRMNVQLHQSIYNLGRTTSSASLRCVSNSFGTAVVSPMCS